MSKYNLFEKVINNSEADDWENAVNEWEIIDWLEGSERTHRCVCGKEDIKYLFKIRNKFNGNILFPIGSSCIKKFNRKDMNDKVSIRKQLFELLHAVEENKYIRLSADLFSRKLLSWLYNKGAFNSNYNNFDGRKDYDFMLKMFNKRDKDSITEKQGKKINAIILNSIKPFLKELLDGRIIP